MNNPLEAVTQAVNSLVTALKLPDESAKANEVLGEMSFPQFSRLLPYRDYNQESGLFMNDTTMGFMLEAIPINGANESIVEALDHMLRTKLPRGVPFCIHLMSSQLVGDRIEYGLREFSWSGEQAERFNAITRAYYMNAAATQFPLPEGMNLPLTLRHYRVFISYCSPSKKKSRADILEMENLVKIIRASLQGASITTQAVDAQAFIDIVGEMINHNPDSLYPKRRQLDPYSDLNYQCVEDSFDLKVRADYLTLGLRENGRNSTARILNFHLAHNPEIAFLWNMADNYSNLLNPELSISCPFILTLTLVVEDQVKTHSEANLKYMDLEKKSKTSYAKWFPSVEKEAKEWGELRQRLGSGQSSVVSYFLNITAFCKDNNETALEVEQDILNSFRKNGFELISPRFNHMRNFLTCLPFMAGKGLFKQLKEAGVVQRAESFNVANLMPLVADNPLTPAGLLAPTYRNQLAFIDIFFRGMNNTNYNMAVCGTSGAGKTGLIQPLIRSVLDSGGFAVVFDMGDGYKSLCENMGGVYLDGETLRFNPFANITDIDQSAERVRDQLSVMASPNGNYYTDKDNYYVLGSMGERWAGRGAEQLGLQGSVDKDVFTRLLEGRLPDGADLSRMQDGSNKHRPGYDLTFSAPKSVSMMAMLGGDKRLIDAHNQAVDFAVRQVEALASTRVMTDGQSETVLTGNLVMALFNHDTSRDQEPQLHTHAVVANVTQHNGEWKTLSSDKVGKTGFIENVYANQIAFGRLYREKLKEQVEALGYETEVVGKHGMWEMPGVPVEAFSGRSQTIREAVGEDASLKSRDVAALDTRKSKQHVDPEIKMTEWMQTLKETGFDIRAYRDAAEQRAYTRTQTPGPASQDGPDVQQAVTQAIAGLSERKVQFTYTDVLARTVGILPPEAGVIERARAGIDEAISREQLIPLDREKGLFTSGIHVLDELSVRALSRDIMKQNRVTVHPEKSVPRTAGYSDAVSVLAQDRPSLAIVSGQGGAAGQRERVAELVMMAREQGREVQIIAADRRSQMNLKQDERLSGELITGRRQLLEGMAFTPGSTVIVDQGEKLSLKETLTLLDGAARHNVQVLITDSGQRTGTGSALMAMKDAGVNTYRWQGGEQRPATIISEPDRNVRYARLAGDFAASVKAGEESVAQVSGVREQAILTQAIRSELKTQGVLGHQEVTMTALSPVWLDSRSRYLRDMYRPGMVMEQWNPETRSHDRYVIDRVTAQSHSLTLRDAQGETQVVRISSLDSSWSLFRPEKMPVADGERLRVTGKIPGLRVSGGDRLQVASVSEDAMTVVVPGRAEPASLPVADSPFTALKLENGWVETPGHSVSDSAKVFAAVTQMAMDNATLNGLARSGRDVRLYSSLDETRTAEKLARHPSFTVVSEQIKAHAGETSLETSISLQKAGLHTPAQQAIHLALPVLESKKLAFSMVDLLTEAKSFAAEGTGFTELGGEINAQIKRGDLLYVDVAKGYGTGLLVSRASYEAEKSILRHILEGKEAVTPLMERVPGELMEKLTSGQRAATRMILETSDRFTVVQGYAGVGKTTQFRAVMSAVNMLPESMRPRVVGLGPTHRAVGEMRSAGVDAQTLASFLHDTQLQQRSGETPDFSNTLFLLDESSMVGNTDMARAYALIAAGGGRAVASGDTDQLQAIAPGQPFRLQQTRSAADVAIMKEIVRQTPELREAVYNLINRDVERALSGLERVKPSQVPRLEGAWAPEHSVMEFSHSQEAKLAEAQQKAMLKGEAFPDVPMTLYEAIVRDYTGRTPEAREQTLIVTHLNEDRRVLNSMIHDAREKAGELGKEQVMMPVLNTANIRDGELRRLSTWETHRDALVLVDNVYHRIAGISKDDGLITLEDAEGNTRLISPREAVAEGVTLYTPDTIRVGTGDRMRFTKSDRERGYVANSVWTVTAVSGDSVTLSDGQQTRVIRPGQERAEQHIDLAYAITAHGAQGASETFAIALEGTEGNRKQMAGFESAYVALSRMKQHVQVYTDNRQGWTDAINNAVQKGTAHDVFEPKPDREVMNAERLFSTARELRDVAAGRAVLRQAGLAGGDSPARFIAPGRKYPQPYVALPAFDRNGKSAGIWLNPLTTDDGNGLRGFSGEGRVKGSGDAQFVALQGSRNGESLLADNMQEGVRIARDNPDSGVVVRIAGEGRPWNPGAITGGRVWGDIPDNSVQPGAGNGEPVTAEVLAQRQAEEAIRRETERRADEIVRKMAENKPDLPDGKTEQAVREIAGQERDRAAITEREAALPESVLRESQREREAVREVARENLLQERLQQMERDMVRDLQKEKTLGGD
ncbi:conjugative transfer relaxase/helicase TraI [Escherichia coli]|nr:conjugative transfer relaxase/helicase TraI [Escherichia coli]